MPKKECGCANYPHCRHRPRRFSPGMAILPLGFRIFAIIVFSSVIGGSAYLAASGRFTSGFTMGAGPRSPGSWIIVSGQFIATDDLRPALLLRVLPVYLTNLAAGPVRFSSVTISFAHIFTNMATSPALAADTIASEGVDAPVYKIVPDALDKGHYRVAFLAMCAELLPILPIAVAGFFYIASDGRIATVTISKMSYFSTILLGVVFLTAVLWSWPRKSDRLPRNMYTIADRWTVCRSSKFLEERALNIASPKLTHEIFKARMLLLGNKYQLGFHTELDGKERFGFDVVETDRDRPDWSEDLCNVVGPLETRSWANVSFKTKWGHWIWVEFGRLAFGSPSVSKQVGRRSSLPTTEIPLTTRPREE